MKKKMSDEQIDKAVEIYCDNNGFDEGEPTEDIVLTADDIKCGITVDDKKREKAFLDALNNDLDNAALNQDHTKQPKKSAKFSGKRMSVSISDDDYNKLRDYCTAKGFTMSSFIVQKAMEAVNAEALLNCMQSVVYYTAKYEKEEKPEILEKLSAYTSALERLMGGMNE